MAAACMGQIVHLLPGRLRLGLPMLRGNPGGCARLEQRLRRLPGIHAAWANPDSGRVLIYYDPKQTPVENLLRHQSMPETAAAEVAATLEPGVQPTAGGDSPPVSVTGAGTPSAGLSSAEAHQRLQRFGPNALRRPPKVSFLRRLAEQFKDVMVVTLLAGAGISLLVGRVRDATTIVAILVLNAVVGASQAGKSEGSLDALKRLAAPQARVVRDGMAVTVPAENVVPGDLLLLEAGDKVPADARIVKAVALEAEESMLTGESCAVAKQVSAADAPAGGGLGRSDMLFAGTTLTRGHCLAEVTATGMRTEMGRIAALLGDVKEGPTPLQERMGGLGRALVKGSLVVCGAVVAIGLLRGQPLLEMFLTGISLAVAAIPEGLPTFVTLGLATGVRQMAKKRALVRRLQAVETLGCATVICTDKTGTLTANQMTVRQVYTGGRWYDVTGTGYDPQGEFRRDGNAVNPLEEPDLPRLLSVGILCNNTALEQTGTTWSIHGDATEGALLVAATKAGLHPRQHHQLHRRTAEVPFESSRRRMSVTCEGPDGPYVYTKGAPESVLEICTHLLQNGRCVALTSRLRREIMQAAEQMADRAYRVLATAYRPITEFESRELESSLVFLGLTGLMDPPRPEVPAALARCRRAGIQVVMLTGDHPRTAAAIAQEIGLLEPGGLVLTGQEISRLSDSELQTRVHELRVCARVSPEQKLRVVRALRAQGHVVAMTGDGVNDAPAVKEADIGIAMGQTGTEVTKEAAGLVLADDNFATIVAAVEQGRVTYNNIRKSIRYLLASNIGEVIVMVGAIALGLPLPLIPLQILWLNLVGDGLPALALGAEPADGTEMLQQPRPRAESLFARGLGSTIVRHGLQMGLVALGLYAWGIRSGKPLPVARTLVLASMVLGQLFYVLQCRRSSGARGKSGLRDNPLMAWAIGGSLLLLAGSTLWVPLRGVLQLAPLRANEWALAGLTALLATLALRPAPCQAVGQAARPTATRPLLLAA